MVEMNFGQCFRLKHIIASAEGSVDDINKAAAESALLSLKSLDTLEMRCKNLPELLDVKSKLHLDETLGALEGLEKWGVDFTGCTNLSNITGLGEAIGRLTKLKRLTLNFSFSGLHTFDQLCVENLPSLTELSVSVHSCERLEFNAFDQFCSKFLSIAMAASLTTLVLDLYCCGKSKHRISNPEEVTFTCI